MFHLVYTAVNGTLAYFGCYKNVDNARNMGRKLVRDGKALKFQVRKG